MRRFIFWLCAFYHEWQGGICDIAAKDAYEGGFVEEAAAWREQANYHHRRASRWA